jgi:hypothetical protein
VIALVVMTDGREHITDAIRSAEEHLSGPITQRIIHDDSGDDAHRAWLARTFPDYRVIYKTTRQGFSGAYANAWRFLARQPEPWVFSTEDDFTFTRTVDLSGMVDLLTARPNLAQMALRRQAWSPAEEAAGGIVEQHPADYTDHRLEDRFVDWLEHRRFFTTNPSLFSRDLCRIGWPEVPESEGHFTRVLTADPDTRFGFWGKRDDDPCVTHIGTHRVGHGY